jgi:uncharacterized protein (TIGR01777 family)
MDEREDTSAPVALRQSSLPAVPLRIVIPGGSGQVGQMLAQYFHQRGHHVTVLTRAPYSAPWQTVHWDGENIGSWSETLQGADVCINLAGRSINCRHNQENRKAIYQSRILSTHLLHKVIASLSIPPKVWMNASAATLYKRLVDKQGNDLPQDESSSVEGGDVLASDPWNTARGFMQRVVRDWEAVFFQTATPRTRKIALRSAVTFSPTAGNVFAVMANLVRFSLGGKQGNGRQFVTWIHEADYAKAIEFLINHEELTGPINLTAPNPIPNREFMATLREALDMPNGLPAPAFAIHIGAFFLRTEPELVLSSNRAVPGRLLDAGFNFDFPDWPTAAEDLAQQWRHRHD